MKELPIQTLFQFGTPALYFDSTGKAITCLVFVDIGWRDAFSGYEAHAAEMITVVSILLNDVSIPRAQDQIQIEDVMFGVISVQAQDELIAALHVKKL